MASKTLLLAAVAAIAVVAVAGGAIALSGGSSDDDAPEYTVTFGAADGVGGYVVDGKSYAVGDTLTVERGTTVTVKTVASDGYLAGDDRTITVTSDLTFKGTAMKENLTVTFGPAEGVSGYTTADGTYAVGDTVVVRYGTTLSVRTVASEGYTAGDDQTLKVTSDVTVTGVALKNVLTITFGAAAGVSGYVVDGESYAVGDTIDVKRGNSITVTTVAAEGYTAGEDQTFKVSSDRTFTGTALKNVLTVTFGAAAGISGYVVDGKQYSPGDTIDVKRGNSITVSTLASNGYAAGEDRTVTVTSDMTFTGTATRLSFTVTFGSADGVKGYTVDGKSYSPGDTMKVYSGTAVTVTTVAEDGYVADGPQTVTVEQDMTFTGSAHPPLAYSWKLEGYAPGFCYRYHVNDTNHYYGKSAADGKRFVFVTLTFKNVGKDDAVSVPISGFKVTTDAGYAYSDSSYYDVGKGFDYLATMPSLTKGASYEYTTEFEIGSAETVTGLTYSGYSSWKETTFDDGSSTDTGTLKFRDPIKGDSAGWTQVTHAYKDGGEESWGKTVFLSTVKSASDLSTDLLKTEYTSDDGASYTAKGNPTTTSGTMSMWRQPYLNASGPLDDFQLRFAVTWATYNFGGTNITSGSGDVNLFGVSLAKEYNNGSTYTKKTVTLSTENAKVSTPWGEVPTKVLVLNIGGYASDSTQPRTVKIYFYDAGGEAFPVMCTWDLDLMYMGTKIGDGSTDFTMDSCSYVSKA